MYRGPFVYRKSSGGNAGSSLTLESAAFGGGRLTPDGALLYVTDYLGSVRAVVDGKTGELYKAAKYTAFGDEEQVMIPASVSTPAHQLATAVLPAGLTLRDAYTGKEAQTPDFTTGYTDFGARQYSPALRRWMTPDPLSEKYYDVSPYAFCNNNPVNFVDPDGEDIYYFSEGRYSGKSECDSTHRIANVTYDSKGNATYSFYDFADPINDPASIESGDITQLIFISQSTIIEMLDSQGAFDFNGNMNDFAAASASNRGSQTGKFDYSFSELYNMYDGYMDEAGLATSPYLFITQGENLAHNLMNYGNYLWGATGYTCGYYLFMLKIGAHINSLTNSKYNSYHPQMDSTDDQKSIAAGYRYAQMNKFKKLKK